MPRHLSVNILSELDSPSSCDAVCDNAVVPSTTVMCDVISSRMTSVSLKDGDGQNDQGGKIGKYGGKKESVLIGCEQNTGM